MMANSIPLALSLTAAGAADQPPCKKFRYTLVPSIYLKNMESFMNETRKEKKKAKTKTKKELEWKNTASKVN